MRLTEEEINRAKDTSMLDLVRQMGYTPVKVGKYMTLKEMDSIRIYNDRSWCRWSDNTGGTAIDFMLLFGGCTSVREAVHALLGIQNIKRSSCIPEQKAAETETRIFRLPEPAENYKRVFAYLMKTRHLSCEIVSFFVRQKVLYEENKYHNCVFVGYDPQGIPRHATCRGTGTEKRFVGDVEGNDKRYVLHLINETSDEIKVFESAIDCMSYMDLSGDYKSCKQILGMTSDMPLAQTLKDYPFIRKISFCLDWDKKGREAVYGNDKRIGLLQKYQDLGYRVRDLSSGYRMYLENDPDGFEGKDWNELLGYQKRY